MTAHGNHTGLVVFAVVAGMAMVAVGSLRLLLPASTLYPLRSVRVTYGLMIAMGVVLAGLALGWRGTP